MAPSRLPHEIHRRRGEVGLELPCVVAGVLKRVMPGQRLGVCRARLLERDVDLLAAFHNAEILLLRRFAKPALPRSEEIRGENP